jgi:hypothetical protein
MPRPADRELFAIMELVSPDFFNDAVVHWYRNIFNHTLTKVTLKAIHAGEDIA